MKKLFFILITIFIGINLYAKQTMTNGIYIDNTNTKHHWSVNNYNTLIWNNKPFMPCGFKVVFKSLQDPNNTVLLQEDINLINELNSKNITDILISNNNQLTISNPEILNQIIELLDKNNMTYGIDLSEESTITLKGYVINPSEYRLDGPNTDTTIVKMWENVDSGIFVIVNKSTGEITEKGALAKSSNGQVIIRFNKKLNQNETLIVYPHFNMFNNFDLWQGYNEIRDNIIKYFKHINLGKGFRFFYNPFNLDKLCSVVDSYDFVPTSSGFNLECENYLSNTYFHAPSLAYKWNIIKYDDKLLPSISDFLKLFPLWNNGRGVSSFYSLVTGETLEADFHYSTYWADISAIKLISIQNNMNNITVAIKENIADVPIIFSSSNSTKSLTIKYDKGTCDGFGYNLNNLNIEDINNMGILYSYAVSSPKTTILFGVSNKGYDKSFKNILSNCCYTGYYFNYNTSDINDIKSLNESMTSYSDKGIPFPSVLPLDTTILSDNTLWYPTNEAYTFKKFNDIYAYQKKGSTEITFFTFKGKRRITIVGKNENDCKIIYPSNKKIKKGRSVLRSHEFSFEISNEPVVISNADINFICPKETVEEKINQYEKFIKDSTLEKSNIKLIKENLKNIKEVYRNGAYLNAFGMANENLSKLMILTGSDLWLEAEHFIRTSFDKRTIYSTASENAVLTLDTQEEPKLGDYYISTTINVPFDRSYIMWIGCSKEDISSPFSYSIDNNSYDKVSFENCIPYSDEFVWVKAGFMNLSTGSHSINIKVDDINKKTLKYHLDIDCVFLTNTDNKPKGLTKPDLVLTY